MTVGMAKGDEYLLATTFVHNVNLREGSSQLPDRQQIVIHCTGYILDLSSGTAGDLLHADRDAGEKVETFDAPRLFQDSGGETDIVSDKD